MKKTQGWLKKYLLMAVVIFCGFAVSLLMMEDRIIFQPSPYPAGPWEQGQQALQAEDVSFTTPDGLPLHGWWMPHPAARATLIWYHGNAGNLSTRWLDLKTLKFLKVNLFIFDYRGYGKSEGTPDEAGLQTDSLAAYDFLTKEKQVPPDRLFLLGRSLGGVFASYTASKRKAAGLIIESSLTSAHDMAGVMYPYLPIAWAVRAKLDNIATVSELKLPKLFVHGTVDKVIPFAIGKRLFGAAASPKNFFPIAGADHFNLHETGGFAYFKALEEFITGHLPKAAAEG